MLQEDSRRDVLSPQELLTTYAAMIEEADIGILIIQNNRCVFSNPQASRLTGHNETETMPDDIREVLHPDERDYVVQRIQQRLNGKDLPPKTIELRLLHSSGEYRWAEARSVIIDWRGEAAILAFITDINERKKTEERVEEQRLLLDSIFKDSDLLVSLLDVSEANEFTYTYFSDAFEKINGLPVERFIGLHPENLVPMITPERAGKMEETLMRCATTGRTISFEESFEMNGKPFYWQATLKPVKNNSGRVYRIIASMTDISKRKQYESKMKKYQKQLEELLRERTRQTEQQSSRLHEVEGNLETIIHSIPDGIIIVDADNIIRFANPAAAKILYDNDENLFGIRFPQKFSESVREMDITLKSGEIRSLALRVVHIMWEFRPCSLAVFRDVTVRKQDLQKIRSLSQRLLEVQEKDRREMGNILHDEVGGTITMLRLGTDRVRKNFDGKPVAGLDDIDDIITELANQVRFISYSMRPTMLDDYGLEETIHWYADRYRERTGIGIAYTCQGLENRLPGQIETTTYRIIQEALNNIAKHSGTEKIMIDLSYRKGALSVSVRDMGRGFDPASETRGIGLRQMQDLAELTGGTFTVESAPGCGTTIRFRLPVVEKQG